jgi:putative lipoprotein
MRALLLATLIALLLVLSEKAMAGDRDKLLHFAGTAAISAVTYAITDDAKIAFAVGFGVGLAKELYDSRKGGTGFDKRDLAADALGAFVGSGIVLTFEF